MSGDRLWRWFRRIRSVLFANRLEREIEEEMRQHLELEIVSRITDGMAPDEARASALRDFGNVTHHRQVARDTRWGQRVDVVQRQAQLAFRHLRRAPGFTFTAMITLALGIGATTAMFSVVNTVVLRPLPYPSPGSLVFAWAHNDEEGDRLWSGPEAVGFREQSTLFDETAFLLGDFVSALDLGGDVSSPVHVAVASDNLLRLLGVVPVAGRLFDRLGADAWVGDSADIIRPALIGEEFWELQFGRSPDVIGRAFGMATRRYEIIGVVPRGVRVYQPTSLGQPVAADVWELPQVALRPMPLETRWISVFGRLRQGVTIEQAQAGVDAFAHDFVSTHPALGAEGFSVRLTPLHEEVLDGAGRNATILLAAVGLVFVIACFNVANLLMARAHRRQRETALRSALGASRAEIMLETIAETTLLAIGGGLAGIVLAYGAVTLITAVRPDALPRLDQVTLDWRVLGFATLSIIAATMISAVIPAIVGSRQSNPLALRQSDTRTVGRGGLARRSFIVLQVAASLALMSGASLMLRSILHLYATDLGFEPLGAVAISVPNTRTANTQAGRMDFYRALQQRALDVPGVTAAGVGSSLPLQYVRVEPISVPEPGGGARELAVNFRRVTPGFLDALRIELVAGRLLEWEDYESSEIFAAVVDEGLAARAWPDTDPVGRVIHVPRLTFPKPGVILNEMVPARVVGVVRSTRTTHPSISDRETAYLTYHINAWGASTALVRTSRPAREIEQILAPLIAEIAPDVPERGGIAAKPLDAYFADVLLPARFSMLLISVFGTLGLALTLIGVYGLVSFTTAQRTAEVGVRLALGARRANIVQLVVGNAMSVTLIGVAVGLGIFAAFGRLLQHELYGVGVLDPVTLVSVATLVAAVSAAAAYLPARRASRLDPTTALRVE